VRLNNGAQKERKYLILHNFLNIVALEMAIF